MKPSDEIIEKFRKIYFEEFGEEISREVSYKKFLGLVNLLRTILRPPLQMDQDTKNPDSFTVKLDQGLKNGKVK